MIEIVLALGMALAAGLLVIVWLEIGRRHTPVAITPKRTFRTVYKAALFQTLPSCTDCAFRDPETCKVCRKSVY